AARRVFPGACALLGLASADLRDALRVRNLERPGRAGLVVEVWQRDARQRTADRALDGAPVALLLRRDERECLARHLRAAGPADTMDVAVWLRGHVEVNDMTERFDIDAARGDVGRHEDRIPAVLEPRERLRPLVLRPVAVDALRSDALLRQKVRQPVRTMLRAGEDERLPEDLATEQFEQQRRLQILRDRIGRLRNAGRWRRLPLQADRHSLLQHLRRQSR